jgi:hypothetical protein
VGAVDLLATLAKETTVAVVIPLHTPRPGMDRNTQYTIINGSI